MITPTDILILLIVGALFALSLTIHFLLTDRVRRQIKSTSTPTPAGSVPAADGGATADAEAAVAADDLFANVPEADEPAAATDNATDNAAPKPFLSVIVTTCDQAELLTANLPLLLQQDYQGSYEVIVVNDNSSDDTADVLERLKLSYPHLRSTFTSSTVRRISRKKLALTMGIKAAHGEWVVITEADCRPTPQWLSALAAQMDADADCLCAHTRLQPVWGRREGQSRLGSLCRSFYALLADVRLLSAALVRQGYMALSTNMAYRTALFFQVKGFSGHLNLERGDDDIFVSENIPARRVRAAVGSEAAVVRPTSVSHRWKLEQTGRRVTRRYLRPLMPLLWSVQSLTYLLFALAVPAAIVCAILWSHWLLLGIVCAVWALHYATFVVTLRPVERYYGEQPFAYYLPLLGLVAACYSARFAVAHIHMPKSTFRRKQL